MIREKHANLESLVTTGLFTARMKYGILYL